MTIKFEKEDVILSNNTNEVKMRPFGLLDKLAYMMGDVGCNIVLSLANSYLLVFYTKVMGVSGAIIGSIFMLARFVDAFTDVFVGRICDTRTNKKGERYRYWMAYGSIPLVISSTLMYNYFLAGAPMPVKVIYLGITYILFGSVCYTAVNIPYGALSNVLTSDTAHRSSLSTWRSVGSQIGGLILGIVIPLAIYVKDADGNNIASGPRFFAVSIILGLVTLAAILFCWKFSVERVRLENQTDSGEKSDNSLVVIKKCFSDRALLMNFGNGIFIYAAIQIFMLFNQYIFLDYFENTSLSGLASVVMFLGMMASAPVATIFGKKIGKKEVSSIGLGISTLAYIVVFVTRVTNPLLYFVGVFFAFFGLGICSMLSFAMLNDCIDNYYIKTNTNAGGTVYAMSSFMRKMAGAVCTGVGGWSLTWIGYAETAVAQTEAVKLSVFNITIGIPAICFGLSLVFMIFFPLNKKRVEENNQKMAELSK